MGIREVRRKTPSTEFLDWKVDIEARWNEPTTDQWYLAQIAQEIVASRYKKPEKIKIEPFLMKFTTKGKEEEAKEEKPISLEEATRRSKQKWFAMVPPKAPIDDG